MMKLKNASSRLTWLMTLALTAVLAACGGDGNDNASGDGGVVAPVVAGPAVSLTVPASAATGVATSAKIVATFTKDMDPATITGTSFLVAGPGGTAVAGTVAYATGARTATFSPAAPATFGRAAPATLPAGTLLTATVTTAAKDVAGNALANNFAWSFTTGAAADTTQPAVTLTLPADSATNVAANAKITATFSKDMDPATITGTTFTLTANAVPVAGSVSYAANSRTAIYTPAAPATLPADTTFVATVTTGAKDLSGNAPASNFAWSFHTAPAVPTTPTGPTGPTGDQTAPSVVSTNPLQVATGVCINKSVNATFSEAMDPSTISTATFTLHLNSAAPGSVLAGSVAYDVASKVATFTSAALAANAGYTATITTGVKDIAGNALAAAKVTTFTTGVSACATVPALGAAAPFGSFGGSATVTNDGLATVINGDIGVSAASTKITGLRDAGGNVYTITPNNNGIVNGLIYTLTAPGGSVAGDAVTQAGIAALAAFNNISPALLTGGIDMSSLAQCPSCGGAGGGPDELAGRTLPPGIYRSSTGTYDMGGVGRTTANLTLDAGGDANAVWVFQTQAGTGTLNVGLTGPATPAVPIQVLLVNGAKAKNVFWYVPGGATIGTGSTMAGTILSNAAISLSTTGGSPPTAVLTTLNGRAIALTAAVTMTNTVINVPAP